MACSFTLPVPGAPEDMYLQARSAILKQGGSVEGTSHNGSATLPTPAGPVSIDYTLGTSGLKVVVTDKPFLVSCSMIEDGMRKAIAQAPVPRARTPAPPVIDVVGEPTVPKRGKVIEIPVTYIEGEVPKPTHSSVVPYLLVGGAALALTAWLLSRSPKRRVRYARA